MSKETTLRKLYDHFSQRGDQLSMDVFKFLLHWNWNYLISTNPQAQEPSEVVTTFIQKCQEEQRVILYGAGIGGNNFYFLMQKLGVEVIGFMDTFKTGLYMGKPIISLEEYKSQYSDILICIAVGGKYIDEVKQTLRQNKIPKFIYNTASDNAYDKDSVFHSSLYPMNSYAQLEEAMIIKARSGSPQYFSLKELPHTANEIFVDCGCYNGENIRDFLTWNGGQGGVYAFEPDPVNFESCQTSLQDLQNVQIFKLGVGEKPGKARFKVFHNSDSHVAPDGESEVEIVSLDYQLEGIPVTFIKMDIEGAELSALKGTQNLIAKYAPKLAICVYHKDCDIWEIPEFIWSVRPDYNFYLRHYEDSYPESVLYGIAENIQ